MAERFEAIKVSLNQSLNDKEKPWKKVFDLAESKSGVPRVYLFAGEFLFFFSFSHRKFVFYLFFSSICIRLIRFGRSDRGRGKEEKI